MAEIPLRDRQGNVKAVAIVDEDDYEWLRGYNWHYDNQYSQRNQLKSEYNNGSRKRIRMHREILERNGISVTEFDVDHINGNKLDNRKENLRVCTHSENCCNRGVQTNNQTKLKGVYWHKRDMVFDVIVVKNKVRYFIGRFNNKDDAARAYNNAVLKYHGEFAVLNEV